MDQKIIVEQLNDNVFLAKADDAEAHTIRNDGQVMSVVAIRDGEHTDSFVTGNFENNCIWTACYVAAEAYRHRLFGDMRSKNNARRSCEALLAMQNVTETPGLIARGFKDAIIATWDEEYFWRNRDGNGASAWHNGLDLAGYQVRFLTDTSKGQLEGWLFGVCEYYDACADDDEKERIRAAVNRTIGAYFDQQFRIIDVNGEPTAHGAYTPLSLMYSGNRLRILALLKRAFHITENPKFQEKYDTLAKKKKWVASCVGMFDSSIVRAVDNLWPRRFHNSDHLEFIALDALAAYEDDSQLRPIVEKLQYEAHHYAADRNQLPFQEVWDDADIALLRRMVTNKIVDVIVPKPMRDPSKTPPRFGARMRDDYNRYDEFEWRRDDRYPIAYRGKDALPGKMLLPAVDYLYAYWKMRWKLSQMPCNSGS